MAVCEKDAGDRLAKPIEEAMAQERLPGAGLSEQQGEGFIIVNRLLHLRQGPLMARRGIITRAVRQRRERPAV
jgi:hypothetical protein